MTTKRHELIAVGTHRPIVIEIHDPDGAEPCCAPSPAAPPARLDAIALAKLTLIGVAAAHGIAAVLCGPATVVHVLWANLTGMPL